MWGAQTLSGKWWPKRTWTRTCTKKWRNDAPKLNDHFCWNSFRRSGMTISSMLTRWMKSRLFTTRRKRKWKATLNKSKPTTPATPTCWRNECYRSPKRRSLWTLCSRKKNKLVSHSSTTSEPISTQSRASITCSSMTCWPQSLPIVKSNCGTSKTFQSNLIPWMLSSLLFRWEDTLDHSTPLQGSKLQVKTLQKID